jgi:hypothetical protein
MCDNKHQIYTKVPKIQSMQNAIAEANNQEGHPSRFYTSLDAPFLGPKSNECSIK